MKIKTKGFEVKRFAKEASKLNNAVKSAASDAAKKAQTQAIKNLKKDLGLKITISKLKQRYLTRVKYNSNGAEFTVIGKPSPIVDFLTRKVVPTKKPSGGVTVAIKGKRQTIKGSFMAKLPNGYTGVFARQGNTQYPIKQLFTTRPSEFLSNDDQQEQLTQIMYDTFIKRLASKIEYLR